MSENNQHKLSELLLTASDTNQKLRILYLTHYFPPEVNAPAMRVSELCRNWKQAGHQVTIQTGFPNHPAGVIPEEHRGKLFERKNSEFGETLRSYVYAAPNKGFAKRVVNYLSFMFSTLLLSSWRSGKADVVIGTSPQFFVAVAAWITSLVKRAPFVFEVRDLWPEEIVAVGAIKNRFVIGMLTAMEMFLYRRATLIVAVAQGTIDDLVERGISPDKLALIPNGVSMERFAGKDGSVVRKRFNLNGEFLVSYIGTHGMAHRLETALEAAETLKDNKQIKFMMVGDGAEKNRLQDMANERKLENVIFAPQASADEIPDYYAAADVCLAPLRNTNLFTRNIPSKLYEIMAAGKPILLGAKGESERLVAKANSGKMFEPESGASLAEEIQDMFDNRAGLIEMGRRGRAFVAAECKREDIAERYIQHLNYTVKRRDTKTKVVHNAAIL
ncbi:glycosyltransferase family 4 protein [bacterium AH-315-F03]|nr:glycosyltransferase family 4 protein [bacterium AH-315-F03]